jgi:type I restriction enzyme M protein
MNMILHDFPNREHRRGGEATLVKPTFLDGQKLRTYDYVVANPPFSDKTWSTGLILGEGGSGDPYQRSPGVCRRRSRVTTLTCCTLSAA